MTLHYPVVVDGCTFYLELSDEVAGDAVTSLLKTLKGAYSNYDHLFKQLEKMTDKTPWKIVHTKRMEMLDAFDTMMNAHDTLQKIIERIETNA